MAPSENSNTAHFCKLCASADLEHLAFIKDVPIHVGVLFDSPEEARKSPRASIILQRCRKCGFVQNGAAENKSLFKPGYEVSLHHSPVYAAFLEKLAGALLARYALRGKNILDIACGAGHFLELLCSRGENSGTGIDPCVPHQQVRPAGAGHVRYISDFYTEKYCELPVDFVCCRHMLHVHDNPSSFLRILRKNLGPRHIPVYFEVVNAQRTAENAVVWQLLYENKSYFTERTLRAMFEASGFQILDAKPSFEDGQYLSIEAAPDPTWREGRDIRVQQPDPTEDALFKKFAELVDGKVRAWDDILLQKQSAGKRIALWGLGGRGITFLNLVDAAKSIPYVVDINPDRQGKFIPGSAQMVLAPAMLKDFRPDCVVMTNLTYRREIEEEVASMGLSCELLTA
jgi:2-polyprenyl-3-methyl-5-hydroxy-6-metoxy-1,4-benzoquinol methylase